MPVVLSDKQIGTLIRERKPLPNDYQKKLQLQAKRGHKEAELDLKGDNGSEFVLILRQSEHNPLDFSVVLGYRPPKTNSLFRLRRYNGKSHEHTNKIESNAFYDFHVHAATERYQSSGFREDSYAEPTTTFADFTGALNALLLDCNFVRPPQAQGSFFGRGT
jgi:hypothetical protein